MFHFPTSSHCVSCELWSKLLKGGLKKGMIEGTAIGVIKGDTRSLEYSSCRGLGFGVWGGLGCSL